MTDVTIASLDMAERAFRQRDKLAKALEAFLRFCDEASPYELEHARDYSAYLNARAALDEVRIKSAEGKTDA